MAEREFYSRIYQTPSHLEKKTLATATNLSIVSEIHKESLLRKSVLVYLACSFSCTMSFFHFSLLSESVPGFVQEANLHTRALFCPEGMLQLWMCRMHHLLAMSLLWLNSCFLDFVKLHLFDGLTCWYVWAFSDYLVWITFEELRNNINVWDKPCLQCISHSIVQLSGSILHAPPNCKLSNTPTKKWLSMACEVSYSVWQICPQGIHIFGEASSFHATRAVGSVTFIQLHLTLWQIQKVKFGSISHMQQG